MKCFSPLFSIPECFFDGFVPGSRLEDLSEHSREHVQPSGPKGWGLPTPGSACRTQFTQHRGPVKQEPMKSGVSACWRGSEWRGVSACCCLDIRIFLGLPAATKTLEAAFLGHQWAIVSSHGDDTCSGSRSLCLKDP